jgi:hypothetical protein
MRFVAVLVIAAAAVSSVHGRREGSSHLERRQAPVKSCTTITEPTVPGAAISNFTAAQSGQVCNVDIHLTHSSANDRFRIQIHLPLTG